MKVSNILKVCLTKIHFLGLTLILLPGMGKSDLLKSVYHTLVYDSLGNIDGEKTIEALQIIGANSVTLELGWEKQWNNFLNFLSLANQHNIQVYLVLPDSRHGLCPCGGTPPDTNAPSSYCVIPKPYCRDYVSWIIEFSQLSLQYPVLQGVFIDDFAGGIFAQYGGFTLPYIDTLMQIKNGINPNFKFLPGVYLPIALCDFYITQKRAPHLDSVKLTTNINYSGNVNNAYFELILREHKTVWWSEYLYINDSLVFKKDTLGGLRLVTCDLSNYNLNDLTITFKMVHRGSQTSLHHYLLPRLIIDSVEIPLTWTVVADTFFRVIEYYEVMKQYYNLCDGVIFWSNAFDLITPENEINERLLAIIRQRVGFDKFIVGHFYGAEPWRYPVFPSEYYFDTFAKANLFQTDGAAPWYGALLSYYVNYSSNLYEQPINNNPQYDYRFHYPGKTSCEIGFFQGIKTVLILPDSIWQADLSFRITDSYYSAKVKWVKELVIPSGEFEQNYNCYNQDTCLWFRESRTLWWDTIGYNYTPETVVVDLMPHISPSETLHLILRMRLDQFKWGSASPPNVNVYLTKPIAIINNDTVLLNWEFISGNAMENIWLNSSEKLRELYHLSPVQTHRNLKTPSAIFSAVFPNPSRDGIKIKYILTQPRKISIKIYDIQGRVVKTLINGEQSSNIYTIPWDLKDDNNKKVANGVYFYEINIPGEKRMSGKFVVIK